MAGRQSTVTTAFEAGRVIRPIFTGGAISLDKNARVLATTLGEDVVLTDPKSGRHLAKVEGDGEQVSTLTCTSAVVVPHTLYPIANSPSSPHQ